MPLPKSKVKINKDGVFYESSVDRTKFTMLELERAALRDIGKLLKKRVRAKIPKDSGDARKSIATWNKKPFRGVAAHLSIGNLTLAQSIKKSLEYVYYMHILEFGSKNKKAERPLRGGVMESIGDIRKIEAQYLAYIEDEQKALSVIDESEEVDSN